MKTLTNLALNKTQLLGAEYAGVRIAETWQQVTSTRNSFVRSASETLNAGFGVRRAPAVCIDGVRFTGVTQF